MAKKVYEEAKIAAIADKIREKTGTAKIYTTAEMPEGVEAVFAAGVASGGGGGGSAPILQDKSATPTKEKQTFVADIGFDGIGTFTVGAIPSQYIIPSGTQSITSNGTHDVTDKESVNVNVPIPDGYIKPSGTAQITSNGTHNIKQYENATVNVPIPDGYIKPSGTLEITESGTYNVTNYASAEVNVSGGGNLVDYSGSYVSSGGSSVTINVGVEITEKFFFYAVSKSTILAFTHSWDGTNYVYASVMGAAPTKTVNQSAIAVSSDRKSIIINYSVPTTTLEWVLVVEG